PSSTQSAPPSSTQSAPPSSTQSAPPSSTQSAPPSSAQSATGPHPWSAPGVPLSQPARGAAPVQEAGAGTSAMGTPTAFPAQGGASPAMPGHTTAPGSVAPVPPGVTHGLSATPTADTPAAAWHGSGEARHLPPGRSEEPSGRTGVPVVGMVVAVEAVAVAAVA